MPDPRSSQRERFELVSRGDLVPGWLWRGLGGGPHPLVLVAPAVGSGKDAAEVGALCLALAALGLSVAAIDLPLQGERASAKLSARLMASAAGADLSLPDQLLWREYRRQVASDLDSTRAALARDPMLRAEAVGCAAFEPGAAAALDWATAAQGVRACRALPRAEDPVRAAASLREQLS